MDPVDREQQDMLRGRMVVATPVARIATNARRFTMNNLPDFGVDEPVARRRPIFCGCSRHVG